MLETTQETILFIVIMSVLIIGIISVSLLNASIQKQIKNDLTAWKKRNHKPIYQSQIDNLNNEISMLRSKVEQFDRDIDPIVQERKKAEKLKAMKSFNTWKMTHTHENGQCAECFGDILTIETNISTASEPREIKWLYGNKRPYPTHAKYRCNDCGHIISEWKFGGRD
ncbi:hypothetical protein [Staphylococcus sp. LKG3-3]|uniref:hypothetical protein n=1 Tax=Staphylococcus sp. LKG3-3 TaxID=3399685 RepID=UPI003D423935